MFNVAKAGQNAWAAAQIVGTIHGAAVGQNPALQNQYKVPVWQSNAANSALIQRATLAAGQPYTSQPM